MSFTAVSYTHLDVYKRQGQDRPLGFHAEINQDVAQEDDIQGRKAGPRLDQIALLEIHHAADFGFQPPVQALLVEVAGQQRRRQAPIDLNLGCLLYTSRCV